jgi:hypothetical protein
MRGTHAVDRKIFTEATQPAAQHHCVLGWVAISNGHASGPVSARTIQGARFIDLTEELRRQKPVAYNSYTTSLFSLPALPDRSPK